MSHWQEPQGRTRTYWRDCIARLACEHLDILLDKLEEVAKEREVMASLLRLVPP